MMKMKARNSPKDDIVLMAEKIVTKGRTTKE